MFLFLARFKSFLSTDRYSSRLACLVGLCLLAFGLRALRLDFHPIWFDEDLAYQRATAALDIALNSMAGSPLYYILLRGWAEVAGSSLFALRYLSALLGTLTIPLIYRLTRRLLGEQVATATMAVATVAPFYVYYAQEARMYTLTLVLMLASMVAFVRWLDTRQGWRMVVCCCMNLLCLYTHYVGGLMILAQGVMALVIRFPKWKDTAAFAIVQAVMGLAFLPWLWKVWRLLPHVVAPQDSATLDVWSILARTWTEFSVGRTLTPPLSLYLAVVPLFLSLAGLLSLFEKGGPGSNGPRFRFARVALLAWLMAPIIGSLLVPRASVRFSPKYLIAVTPVYYTLIVLGLAALRRESRALFWLSVILLLGVFLYTLGDYYIRPHDKLAAIPNSQVCVRAERRSENLVHWFVAHPSYSALSNSHRKEA